MPGQTVSIMFTNRTEMATGKAAGTSPGVTEGTVAVQITSALPPCVQQGVAVHGTIEVGRPVECQPNSTVFKLEPNGEQAVQVKVEFGRVSRATVGIRSGLAPGDKMILSDMAPFRQYDRITLK
jgi:HlyD family secretion protein